MCFIFVLHKKNITLSGYLDTHRNIYGTTYSLKYTIYNYICAIIYYMYSIYVYTTCTTYSLKYTIYNYICAITYYMYSIYVYTTCTTYSLKYTIYNYICAIEKTMGSIPVAIKPSLVVCIMIIHVHRGILNKKKGK